MRILVQRMWQAKQAAENHRSLWSRLVRLLITGSADCEPRPQEAVVLTRATAALSFFALLLPLAAQTPPDPQKPAEAAPAAPPSLAPLTAGHFFHSSPSLFSDLVRR